MNKTTLDDIAKALLERVGVISPNSSNLDRKIARLLVSREFSRSGITIREVRSKYLSLCSKKLKSSNL